MSDNLKDVNNDAITLLFYLVVIAVGWATSCVLMAELGPPMP